MSKALNLGHLEKVLWKYLNSTNTKGSPLCDVEINEEKWISNCHSICKYNQIFINELVVFKTNQN